MRTVLGVLVVLSCFSPAVYGLNEEDRLREYAKRNYTWPVPEFRPVTKGWDKVMRERLAQVAQLKDQVSLFLDNNRFVGGSSQV